MRIKMLYVLISLSSGTLIGFLIRKKKASGIFGKATSGIIFVLLFLLGMTVGMNESLFKNLPTVGLKALVLTLGGIFGSVSLSFVIYRLFFRDRNSNRGSPV